MDGMPDLFAMPAKATRLTTAKRVIQLLRQNAKTLDPGFRRDNEPRICVCGNDEQRIIQTVPSGTPTPTSAKNSR